MRYIKSSPPYCFGGDFFLPLPKSLLLIIVFSCLTFRLCNILFLLFFVVASTVSCKKSNNSGPAPQAKYELEWSDEFDYTGLPNPNNWSYESGKVRSNEAQFYTVGNPENAWVNNGVLTITATYDTARTHKITSASIHSLAKKEVLFGRLEMKAKMPSGLGAWPAFWTMGINRSQVGWPACGEIDIMEWLGYLPGFVFGSIHKANAQNVDAPMVNYYAPSNPNFSTEFHTYAIEWDNEQIKFFFDDVNYVTYSAVQMTAKEWEQFSKPHYILANLAIGGNSGGSIDYTKFPFTYVIDYIRVYKKK